MVMMVLMLGCAFSSVSSICSNHANQALLLSSSYGQTVPLKPIKRIEMNMSPDLLHNLKVLFCYFCQRFPKVFHLVSPSYIANSINTLTTVHIDNSLKGRSHIGFNFFQQLRYFVICCIVVVF